MSDLVSNFVKKFHPGKDLQKPDAEILKFAEQMLPKEIIELWTEYGFGEYGDGLLKVVDPRAYMGSLYSWLGKEDFSKIPLMVSAFGEIFYYRCLTETDNDMCMLDIHYRKITVCTYSYKDFFEDYIVDDEIIGEVLRRELYNEAKEKLGKLAFNEIFFFTPALALGGAENLKYIDKGDATVHHQVLLG